MPLTKATNALEMKSHVLYPSAALFVKLSKFVAMVVFLLTFWPMVALGASTGMMAWSFALSVWYAFMVLVAGDLVSVLLQLEQNTRKSSNSV